MMVTNDTQQQLAEAANKGVKRYNLVLPILLFQELQSVAEEQEDTIVGVLKKFIKIGLMIVAIQRNNPDAEIVIRDKESEKTILPLW